MSCTLAAKKVVEAGGHVQHADTEKCQRGHSIHVSKFVDPDTFEKVAYGHKEHGEFPE